MSCSKRARGPEPPSVAVMNTLRAGVIQSFEYTYELSVKMLKRRLRLDFESRAVVDAASFKDLMRMGGERRLVSSVEAWFGFRTLRNETMHTYDLEKAEQVASKFRRLLAKQNFCCPDLRLAMNDLSRIDLTDAELAEVDGILNRHIPSCTVWVYGSRADGSAQRYSDLDLAIVSDAPLSLAVRSNLTDDFQSPTCRGASTFWIGRPPAPNFKRSSLEPRSCCA